MNKLPLIIMGAGGHGQVVASALLLTGRKIHGFLDQDPRLWGKKIRNLPVIGGDGHLEKIPRDSVELVNGIGSTQDVGVRKQIFEHYKFTGFTFASVIHPAACVAQDVVIGEGVQIMAAAVIQNGVKILPNVIINTGAIIDHNCAIGAHTHIAPAATISGGVKIGSCSHIGVGAVIIQSVQLGDYITVGAGAVVINSQKSHSRLIGVPAKIMRDK